MNNAVIQDALSSIRDCALAMMENAIYVQSELPRVEMEERLRVRTSAVCQTMIGTKHDVIHDLFEIDALLESKSEWAAIAARIDTLINWLYNDLTTMHHVIMALRKDSKKNENHTLALILVQESAANILIAFNRAKSATDALAVQK